MSDKQSHNRLHSGNWGKGQSGNPAGRPKAVLSLTEMLREYGEQDMMSEREILLAKEHLAKTVYTAIIHGYRLVEEKKVKLSDVVWINCLKWLYDRVDGKPTENVAISLPDVQATSEDYAEAMKELAEWRERRESKSD